MTDINGFVPINNYENNYLVSKCGDVYSIQSKKILKPYTDKDGYQIVGLFNNGKQKKCKIHRIVATAFIPNPNNYSQVNHKDENPANNFVENLEWCDCSYNINYGNRNNKVAESLRKNPLKKRRKVSCYDTNMNLIKTYPSLRSVEKDGYNRGAVYLNCNNKSKTKTYKSYIWKYVE